MRLTSRPTCRTLACCLSSGTFFSGPNLSGPASYSAVEPSSQVRRQQDFHTPHGPLWRFFQPHSGRRFCQLLRFSAAYSWTTSGRSNASTSRRSAANPSSCRSWAIRLACSLLPGGECKSVSTIRSTALRVGNGQGFNTGSLPSVSRRRLRTGQSYWLYLGDTWKIKPNFTVNVGSALRPRHRPHRQRSGGHS